MKCSTGLTCLHLSWLKRPGGGQKSVQGGISLQTALPEYCAHFELGFGQPVICAKYPSVDQCYGVFSTFGSQISGRIMLPMSMSTEDVPIYVNAKQYHGIIRRRKSRAKAAMENKLPRNRKPYMHRSRHLHAMRRPRGCGGRFLNAKELNDAKGITDAKKAGDFQLSQPTGSQNSEVLESGGATLNSSMEANCGGSNLSGSEVTSMYNRVDFDRFPFNHQGSTVHGFSGMDGGHGIAMPSSSLPALHFLFNFSHNFLKKMAALSMAASTVTSSPLHTKLSNLSFTHSPLPLPSHFSSKPLHKPLKALQLNNQNSNSLSLLSLPHSRGIFSATSDSFEAGTDENITAQDDPQSETDGFDHGVVEEEVEVEDGEDVEAIKATEEGKLYVGNLPYSTTSSELTEAFEEAGRVLSAEVIYDRVTDRSRGFGFVNMGSVEEAKKAIQMFNGTQFGGRSVRVNFPEVPRGGEREVMGPRIQSGNRGFIDSEHKIYAGNLGWRLTSEGLKDAFANQLGVISAKVIYERDSRRSRGFGFVSFESAENAEAALEAMNGVEVEGRPLRLNLAGERSPPPSAKENSTENNLESGELLSSIGA
uniref:Nuclear transcription factor Y subunit n=1 Tax=Salix viminalis TaxID=40686 RepID=A0A6N2N6B3_SALVM